jgi:hypothetical protein
MTLKLSSANVPSGKEWSFGSSDARMVGGALDPGSEERDGTNSSRDPAFVERLR